VLGLWFCGSSILAQDAFQIREARIASGIPAFSHDSGTNYYYILLRGSAITDIRTAVDLRLGAERQGQLQDSSLLPSSQAAFYRIQRVSLHVPLDTDGDGIDDVYELLHQPLNPLLLSDSRLPGPSGKAWIDIYQDEKLGLIVYFPTGTSTSLSTVEQVRLPIRFSKPYQGSIGYVLSGTAVYGEDYTVDGYQPKPEVPNYGGRLVAQTPSSDASLVIQIKKRPRIEADRTLLVHLTVSATGSLKLGNPATHPATHAVVISDGPKGIYDGILSFGEGSVLPPLKARFALSSTTGNDAVARFSVPEAAMLGQDFSLGVQINTDGTFRFQNGATASGSLALQEFLGRESTWQLTPESLVFPANPPAANDPPSPQASFLLRLQGLTASNQILIIPATLRFSRSN
jgi:hypothetical protein